MAGRAVEDATVLEAFRLGIVPPSQIADWTVGRDGVPALNRAVEQRYDADEALGGTVTRQKLPPHTRTSQDGRGHRFAACPRS